MNHIAFKERLITFRNTPIKNRTLTKLLNVITTSDLSDFDPTMNANKDIETNFTNLILDCIHQQLVCNASRSSNKDSEFMKWLWNKDTKCTINYDSNTITISYTKTTSKGVKEKQININISNAKQLERTSGAGQNGYQNLFDLNNGELVIARQRLHTFQLLKFIIQLKNHEFQQINENHALNFWNKVIRFNKSRSKQTAKMFQSFVKMLTMSEITALHETVKNVGNPKLMTILEETIVIKKNLGKRTAALSKQAKLKSLERQAQHLMKQYTEIVAEINKLKMSERE